MNPPFVRTQPGVIPIDGVRKLSSLYSVSDLDEDSEVTRVRVRDNVLGRGYFELGGNVLNANVFHEISAFQLESVNYHGASFFTQETFTVQVFDGEFWSNQATAPITTGNVSPVVEGFEGRLSATDEVSIDPYVSITDGDGDAITKMMLVDRRNNFGGGQFFLDGVAKPQARWFSVEAGDFSRLRYRGADEGRDVELIGIMAWDGYSWSEITEFSMATTTAPIVIGEPEEVLVDAKRSATELFTAVDADGDSLFSANFVDYRINSDGGYWEYDGNAMPSATWFTVLATNFDKLFYVGGSTGPQSEQVGVQVFDGYQFSDVGKFNINTVTYPEVSGEDVEIQRGHYLSMATGQTKNSANGLLVGEGETVLNYLDADGDEIDLLMFNSRSINSNGGHFVFKGEQMPDATYFYIQADDLDQLFYRGGSFGPQTEQISVLAHSNGIWSEASEFTIDTLPNLFAPEVALFNVEAKLNVGLNLTGMFTWSDGDGDAIDTFSIQDPLAGGGFFALNGVAQPSGTWLTFDWDQRHNIQYRVSNVAGAEEVEMRLFDGRAISTDASTIINAYAPPVVDADQNDISVDTIERVLSSSMFTQLDGGPAPVQWQVYDGNTDVRSGRLELNGEDLQQGLVHTLPAAEFGNLFFKGAETDNGRQIDPFLVRADNGVSGWSEWERVNVTTDPVGANSLRDLGTWGGVVPGETLEITYTFIDGNTPHPAPYYYRCEPEFPMTDPDIPADDECNVAGEDKPLNQPQREAVRRMLGDFENYANLEFREVAYFPTLGIPNADGANAGMVFGSAILEGAAGWAYPGGGDGQGSKSGDVWFAADIYDPDNIANFTNVGYGESFNFTGIHEIGHTMGFKHSFDLESGPEILSIFNDFQYNTVMSYTADSIHNPYPTYPEPASTVMLFDVVRLQEKYGANVDFNSGNTHYGNYFAGAKPNFFTNSEQHQTTLWDGGGIDTLNYTNHVADETIDLRVGTWSSINGLAQSLRIAYDTQIENARGGSGNDNIRGNETANLLFGNDGDDVLRGGGDNDVMRPGAGDDIVIWSLGDGRDYIREEGNGGLDTIEFYDPSGQLDSLEDDFLVVREESFTPGSDATVFNLRINFTPDKGAGEGTVTIVDQSEIESQVELMSMFGLFGQQVGVNIDLTSLAEQATNIPTRFQVTDVLGANGGFTVEPFLA
ncbi:MAG: M10 family metallopeptidase C-terminal domain-containing protein [Pirellulales bacterium]